MVFCGFGQKHYRALILSLVRTGSWERAGSYTSLFFVEDASQQQRGARKASKRKKLRSSGGWKNSASTHAFPKLFLSRIRIPTIDFLSFPSSCAGIKKLYFNINPKSCERNWFLHLICLLSPNVLLRDYQQKEFTSFRWIYLLIFPVLGEQTIKESRQMRGSSEWDDRTDNWNTFASVTAL